MNNIKIQLTPNLLKFNRLIFLLSQKLVFSIIIGLGIESIKKVEMVYTKPKTCLNHF
jgi:hypothetical protein